MSDTTFQNLGERRDGLGCYPAGVEIRDALTTTAALVPTVAPALAAVTAVYTLGAPISLFQKPTDTRVTINIAGAAKRLVVFRGRAPQNGSVGAVVFSWGDFGEVGTLFALEAGGYDDGIPRALVGAESAYDRPLLLPSPRPSEGDYILAMWYDGERLGLAMNGGAPVLRQIALSTVAGNLVLGAHPDTNSIVDISELEIYDQYSNALRDTVVARMASNAVVPHAAAGQAALVNAVVTAPAVSSVPALSATPVAGVPSSPNDLLLQLIKPFETVAMTLTQPLNPNMAYNACVAYPDATFSGLTTFSGLQKGMRNIDFYIAEKRFPVTFDDSTWTVDIDLDQLPIGPLKFHVLAWDSAPGSAYINSLKIDSTILNGTGVLTAPLPPPAAMKLIFRDTFTEAALDTEKYLCGNKIDGSQWGGAYFVNPNDPFFAETYKTNAYGRGLRLRAVHRWTPDASNNTPDPFHFGWKEPGPKNPDPTNPASKGAAANGGWINGRTWTGPQATLKDVLIRKGIIRVVAMVPKNKGAWPAPLWLLNDGPKSVEIDTNESYGAHPTDFVATLHDYTPTGDVYVTQSIHTGMDLTESFHTYEQELSDTETVWRFDGKEVKRTPLPHSDDLVGLGKFYPIMDLSLSYDWPVDVPPAGYIDLWIDSIEVYEAS